MTPDDIRDGLNQALNEATIAGGDFDQDTDTALLVILPIAVDESGDVPEYRRVMLWFQGVSRMAVSYRMGNWDDDDAEVRRIHHVSQLGHHLAELPQSAMYGSEFVDVDGTFARWKDRLSLDHRSQNAYQPLHTVEYFHNGNGRHVDVRIWYERLLATRMSGERIPIEEFIAAGMRGWAAVYGMDPAVAKFGIVPEEGIREFSKQLFPDEPGPVAPPGRLPGTDVTVTGTHVWVGDKQWALDALTDVNIETNPADLIAPLLHGAGAILLFAFTPTPGKLAGIALGLVGLIRFTLFGRPSYRLVLEVEGLEERVWSTTDEHLARTVADAILVARIQATSG